MGVELEHGYAVATARLGALDRDVDHLTLGQLDAAAGAPWSSSASGDASTGITVALPKSLTTAASAPPIAITMIVIGPPAWAWRPVSLPLPV